MRGTNDKRVRFIDGLLERIELREEWRDTAWFLMYSSYQEGYIDGIADGRHDASKEAE